MTKIEIWGPIVWTFMHSFVEQIDSLAYNNKSQEIFEYIKSICMYLPCPICRTHAQEYLRNIKLHKLKQKIDFQVMLFNFHNVVNKRKHKPQYEFNKLEIYKKYNLPKLFILLKQQLKSRNGLRISLQFNVDSFLRRFTNWLNSNKEIFIQS